MTYETLQVRREGPIMMVKLNRPQKRNAINRQMHTELQALCRELGDDYETRVVILAGEGRGFSGGADTAERPPPGPTDEMRARHISRTGSRTAAALDSLDQITIAAVHGFAVGGGVVLALFCDFRVAGPATWFWIPEVELGMPFTWNSLPHLAMAVGYSRALELTVLAERFSAQQAFEYGFVTHLVPDGEEEAAALDLARKIAARPALPVALTKSTMRAIRRATEMSDVSYSDPELLTYNWMMRERYAPGDAPKGDRRPRR